MAAKISEYWNFLFLHRIIFYYPLGRKFAENRSICNGFWDISKLLKSSTENSQLEIGRPVDSSCDIWIETG